VIFREELYAIFSRDELVFLLKESTLVGEEEDGRICHLFFSRDRGMAEVTLPYEEIDPDEIRIVFLTTTNDSPCTKEELMQFLRDSQGKALANIEVE